MYNLGINAEFPAQKIPNSKKTKNWGIDCIDYIIARGIACKDISELEDKYNILNEKIPEKYYKKILNPYNAKNEKYRRFPATMRNYDIIKGIIRRYIGEYINSNNDFIVGANNPEVVLAKNKKLNQELSKIVEAEIVNKIQETYKIWIEQGNEPQNFDPKQHIDIDEFIKNFNENYIDEISVQGQEILEVIKDITKDTLFYATVCFNYVAFGEAYTYSDVVSNELIKRVIHPIDAYPIPTDNIFVEDDDMFACKRLLTYQQIVDEFDDFLTDNDRNYLKEIYSKPVDLDITGVDFSFKTFQTYYPDVCNKFSNEDRDMFNNGSIFARSRNSQLVEVWHTVWKSYTRRSVVTYVNEIGLITTRTENDDYVLNSDLGDISIEYIYEPQVYEGVRIGDYNKGIYPYEARAIAFERHHKLPYNGIREVLPGFGKFSIIELITPFQIFYNIVAYSREMAIAKNKLSILLIAKSLLGTNEEETLYRMIADGTLFIDDSDDSGMIKSQQIRFLNSEIGSYIKELTELLKEIKQSAKEQVDMTSQRYGEIANSAGKGVTDEAVLRGSMGSVIIYFMINCLREQDYMRDMDFSKLAWIDGLDTSFRDSNNELKYLSLNVENHLYADYIIKAKNSINEKEKLNQLRQFAFNASQNGNDKMAIAAITGDNVAAIKKLIEKYADEKAKHEETLKQLDNENAKMLQEYDLQKIQVKGEEDRKTEALKATFDKEIELIRADANMVSYPNDVPLDNKNKGINRLDTARVDLEKEKIQLSKQQVLLDSYSKFEDRRLKEKDIEAKLEIAKMNKNKFDFKIPKKKLK